MPEDGGRCQTAGMTWTAPVVERPHVDSCLDERGTLEASLTHYRSTLLQKCGGLSGEQLASRPLSASSLSLLGIVRHLAGVERWWFTRWLDRQETTAIPYWDEADEEADFNGGTVETAEQDYATLLAEIDRARAQVAGRSLDEEFSRPRGERANLRWLYAHMIEEYARHCGHADLLREHIDGEVGY